MHGFDLNQRFRVAEMFDAKMDAIIKQRLI